MVAPDSRKHWGPYYQDTIETDEQLHARLFIKRVEADPNVAVLSVMVDDGVLLTDEQVMREVERASVKIDEVVPIGTGRVKKNFSNCFQW